MWLENPRSVLSYAVLALLFGAALITAGLTGLNFLLG